MEEEKLKRLARFCLKIFLAALLLIFFFFASFRYLQRNPDLFRTQVSLEKTEDIGLEQKVTINFSRPVLAASVENSLDINPDPGEVVLQWSENNQILAVDPVRGWQANQTYDIRIKAGKSSWKIPFVSQSIFHTASLPEIISIVPVNGEKNVQLTMEDPITVNFDQSLDNFNLKVIVDPGGEFISQFGENKASVRILPKEELEKGRYYKLRILLKPRKAGEDAYYQIGESSFETKAAEVEKWDDNLEVRLMQARDYARAEIREGKYIDINLNSQIMTIFEDGKLLDAYLVSSGRNGMETPQGSFRIENKALKPWSKEYGLFMPYWMALLPSGKVGIHELPEWPGGYKEGANHLGTRVSHGCVRLGIGAAQRVYEWAPIGTAVIIHV